MAPSVYLFCAARFAIQTAEYNSPSVQARLIKWLIALVIGAGSVSCAPSQTFSVIRHFPGVGSTDIYGMAIAGTTLYGAGQNSFSNYVFKINTDGSGYTVLKYFPPTKYDSGGTPTNSDGESPLAGPLLAGDTLYGTTYGGGPSNLGVVYKISTNGSGFSVLQSFVGTNGAHSYAPLILSGDTLYGTAAVGGDYKKGVVFKVRTNGADFALLKSFAGDEGYLLLGGLTRVDDMLYGTTYTGYGVHTNGTIFTVSTNGQRFAILADFPGGDGAKPRTQLILMGEMFYGVTEGDVLSGETNALVFRAHTNGTGYEVVKRFLLMDDFTNIDGSEFFQVGLCCYGNALYGATREAGQYGNGTLFRVTTNKEFVVLRQLGGVITNSASTNEDGAGEVATLVPADGVLYGCTSYGGHFGGGTLFKLDLRPSLARQVVSNSLVLSWTNTALSFRLQSATEAVGPYTDIPESPNPGTYPLSEARQFFRLISD